MSITFSVTSRTSRIVPAVDDRRDDRDDGGQDQPRFDEQQGEDDDEEEPADREGDGHVPGGVLDVVRRSEQRRVDLHAAQSLAERVECFLDALRDLDGVRVRELLHDEEQAGLARGEDRVADQRLVVLDQLGHVAQSNGPTIHDQGFALVVLDRDLCQSPRLS